MINYSHLSPLLSRVFFAILCLGFALPSSASTPDLIKVDQFGYLPQAQKIAIISDPQTGFNASDTLNPATTYEVRKTSDDSVAFSGAITPWKNGQTHSDSGDKVWWFDFSTLAVNGDYYVYDPSNNIRSAAFSIADDIYQNVMKQAVRSYFYQRANHVKASDQAGLWQDAASHTSTASALLLDPSDPQNSEQPSTARDLSGGWYDAGDYNKYVNNTDGPLHELLLAYEENPLVWSDDYNIPESNNGIPDLLDEVKWELDWLLKMQNSDGSVLHKLSVKAFGSEASPPSTDTQQHYYAPATASATISTAAVFAHAAIVYGSLNDSAMQTYAQTLQTAATNAWNWLEANPSKIPSQYGVSSETGFGTPAVEDCRSSGDCSEQLGNRVIAAIYLYALTDSASYHDYIKANATNKSRVLNSDIDERYLENDGINEEFQNGLLYYTGLSDADSTLATTIKQHFDYAIGRDYVDYAPMKFHLAQTDAYRAHIGSYGWGSNHNVAHAGNALLNVLTYGVTDENAAEYRRAGSGYLHYLHGVNPLSMVYLTNMADAGAENSVTEFYHAWFADDTQYDTANGTGNIGPAPGFLVGGPNQNYYYGLHIDGVQQSSHLLETQPAQKRFTSSNDRDYRTYYITENSISYQAPYIRLLSKFLNDIDSAGGDTGTDTDGSGTPSPSTVVPTIEITVTDQWDDGYCATASLTASKSINDWQFTLQLPGNSFGIWGAGSVSSGENSFSITPVSWNHLVLVGDNAWFDFCGAGDPDGISTSDATGNAYLEQQAIDFAELRVDMWLTGIWSNSYCMDVNITNLTNAPQP